VLPLRLMS